MNYDLTGKPDAEMTIEQFKELLVKMGSEEEEVPPEPVPEPEPIVPDDIVNLFAMEIPESILVEGWTLEIPMGSMCMLQPLTPGHYQRELLLTSEVEEWCAENLQQSYWFLGEGMGGAVAGSWDHNYRTALLYFTLELDYIMFKMRWS